MKVTLDFRFVLVTISAAGSTEILSRYSDGTWQQRIYRCVIYSLFVLIHVSLQIPSFAHELERKTPNKRDIWLYYLARMTHKIPHNARQYEKNHRFGNFFAKRENFQEIENPNLLNKWTV